MANATNVQLRDFQNGIEYLSWKNVGTAYDFRAGKGTSYWVTELKFTLALPASAISIVIRSGETALANSSYPLRYKLLTAESAAYENATTAAYDGSIAWSGAETSAAINISGSYAAGTYYLYLFSGTTSYENYTEIRSNYSTAVTYTEVTQSAVTLNGQGATTAGTSSVTATYGSAMPSITVPQRVYTVTEKPNYTDGTDVTLTSAYVFGGYWSGVGGTGTQYYNADGTSARAWDRTGAATLYAKWTAASVTLTASTRTGYTLDGWYTAASGGTLVGAGGAAYTPAANITLYAHWSVAVYYDWGFNPVSAASNSNDTVVRGVWSGFVGDTEVLCAACNGYLWQLTLAADGTWSKTSCGAITTTSDVHMFGFSEKLWLMNGTEYKVWNGTTLSDVTGYRPLVSVSVLPSGGGTTLEQINKLNGSRRCWFSPDGTSTVFQLPETGITTVDYVKNRLTGAAMTGWTADTANGTVTFTTAPGEGTNTIEIGWTHPTSYAATVRAMRYSEIFNGTQDTRVFIYGDGSNKTFYSGLDYDGEPRADYFPDMNEAEIGDANTPLTALIRHQSRMMAFKLDSAWSIAAYSNITLDDGSTTMAFTVTPINRSVGNRAPGQAVLAENRPRTLDGRSVMEWKATSSSGNINSDQRNAERISQRVDATIRTFDLDSAKTFYDKYRHEYYVIGADGTALVRNEDADAWYTYTGFDATCLISYKDELYFGTADGALRHFSEDYLTDEGTAIYALWESGAMDFGSDFRRKYSAMLWVGIKPEDSGYLAVTAKTDVKSDFAEYPVNAAETGDVPEMARIKLKAKKFTYYKLILENSAADKTATVVSADIRVRGTGYVK